MNSTKYERKCRFRLIILMLQGLSEREARKRMKSFTNEGKDAQFTVADLSRLGVFPHTGALAKLVHMGELLQFMNPDDVPGTDPANIAIRSWETISPGLYQCGKTKVPGLPLELRANLPARMQQWSHLDMMEYVLYGGELTLLDRLENWNPSPVELQAAIECLEAKARNTPWSVSPSQGLHHA